MTAPGVNVTVTTEVGYCPFCQRSRNLRREERRMGGLMRTTIECESCHRVLSSSIGPPPATPAPPAVDVVEPVAAATEPEPEPKPKPKPTRKSTPRKAARPVAAKKTAAKAAPKKAAPKKK